MLAAADVDPEARELREAIRRETLAGATAFVTHLAGTGGLRPDLSVERAADACWGLVNSLLQRLLTTERAWSTAEYREWFVRIASATLLDPESGAAPAASAIEVRHLPEAGRYEAVRDGRVVGRLTYDVGRRTVVLLDTDVDDGHGDAADALVRHAVEDVRADEARRVVAACPYAAWWLEAAPGGGLDSERRGDHLPSPGAEVGEQGGRLVERNDVGEDLRPNVVAVAAEQVECLVGEPPAIP